MTKYLGLEGATQQLRRHMSRCLAVLLSGAAVLAGPGVASARRPDHSTHVHRSAQEDTRKPDFSRASAVAKAHKKHAPSSSARGSEHKADQGQGRSDARSGAKAPHKSSPRRRRQIEPDDDPIVMKRARATRPAKAGASEPRRIAERKSAPAAHTPDREIVAEGPLKTSDFLHAAHGDASEAPEAPSLTSAHTRNAAAPAPFATGTAHPSTAAPRVSPESSLSYIDERQVAENQRVAIGEALRPQESAEARTAELRAAETHAVDAPPVTRASSISSSLPPSAPTISTFAPAAAATAPRTEIATALRPVLLQPAAESTAVQPVAVSALPSERSYIASRTVEGDDTANRAPEDAARSTALGQLSHQEMATAAVAPSLPGLYSRDGHIIIPAPLKGSHEVLLHQNEMADAAGLSRIRNDRELDQMRREHRLVDFEDTDGLRINPELPERRRCARPWTVAFAVQMGRAYYAEFHEPFTISSAVRTMAFQARLQRVNGNAAATRGEAASPHLTGQAFDIGKTGLTRDEIAWLRTYLAPIIDTGKIDVEEEFRQACFHISVYPGATPHRRTQLAEIQ